MSPLWVVDTIIALSLLVTLGAYVGVSRHDGSFVNILTPTALLNIPSFYLLPLIYVHLFQPEGTSYAYAYVYSTLGVQSVAFAYFFTRKRRSYIRLPFAFGYAHFWRFAVICVILAAAVYVPVLIQFPSYILNPRQIYIATRTGFGVNSFTSSTLAYLGVVLALFSGRSLNRKALLVAIAAIVLSLHGSKGQLLEVLFFVLLYLVYVKGRRFRLFPTLVCAAAGSGLILLMFAASMFLGESPLEVIETISEYSDYTRNDVLVIDSHLPLQHGRLTLESNTISLIPRAVMPDKPKNFGTFYLAEEFFPERFDADTGAPAFAIGVPYADFGWLAIVYLGFFSCVQGWLARSCVDRLRVTQHPADFLLVAFLADVSLFPIGAGGWFLPETLLVVLFIRFISCSGAGKVYRERTRTKTVSASTDIRPSTNEAGETC